MSTDPAEAFEGRIAQHLPGIRWFLDPDWRISKLYGVAVDDGNGQVRYAPFLLLPDHRLRVAGRFPIEEAEAAVAATAHLVAVDCETPTAPVLIIPRISNQRYAGIL